MRYSLLLFGKEKARRQQQQQQQDHCKKLQTAQETLFPLRAVQKNSGDTSGKTHTGSGSECQPWQCPRSCADNGGIDALDKLTATMTTVWMGMKLLAFRLLHQMYKPASGLKRLTGRFINAAIRSCEPVEGNKSPLN